MKISNALDEFQLPFAQDTKRSLRLLAPAGSGKTHSLLWRCVQQWKSAKKSKPRFLLFTFTKAARDELKYRLRTAPEFNDIQHNAEVSTLNAWGYKRLRSRTHSLRLLTSSKELFWALNNNLQPVWTKHAKLRDLLTQTTSKYRTAKALMATMDGFKSLGFRHDIHYTAGTFQQHAKFLGNLGLTTYLTGLLQQLADLQIITTGTGDIAKEIERGFLGFWREATTSLREMAMITLEDQKYWAWLDVEEALAEEKFTTGIHRYDHILVDEFQDINCLDLRLLQGVAQLNKSELTLVGDDDQAIYEWRGASPQFILDPDSHVGSGYRTHILSRNYRSPRNIVTHSQKLIKHNKRRVDKEIHAASKIDADLEVLQMPSINDSIDYVVKEAQKMLSDGSIENVAIIGRKRGQIIPYQIAFAANNMPFYAAEDLQLFLSDAFGDLQDMLGIKARAAVGPIPGIDPVQDAMKLIDKVKRFPVKKSERTNLFKYFQSQRPRTLAACIDALRRYTGPLKGTNDDGARSNSFANAIASLISAESVSGAIQSISENFEGLRKDYGKSLEDIFYADPPFLHLAEFAQRYRDDYQMFYDDLDKAIATLARLPTDEDNDSLPPNKSPDWKLPLHLMTALRAKGKEFDAVIILDVNQGIWPNKLATTPEQLEQERRVFYVAFTRARKRISLLVSGTLLDQPVLPSPYLSEMGLAPQNYASP